MTSTTAEFSIDLQPGDPILDGTGRFDFTKKWSGGITGTSTGFMASAGDPQSGNAGYVALETVTGSVDGVSGSFVLQQFGVMADGKQDLVYDIAPGSGTDGLSGITGEITLDVDEDGTHRVRLDYSI